MNPYYYDWYQSSQDIQPYMQIKYGTQQQEQAQKVDPILVTEIAMMESVESIVLRGARQGLTYLARSQVKGNLGRAARLTGRLGVRAVPVVGTVLLIYDAYTFYQWLTED